MRSWLGSLLGRGGLQRSAPDLAADEAFSIKGDLDSAHPYANAAAQFEDVLEGMQHCATLRLRTPLRYLLRDGEVRPPSELPETSDPAHEIWVPKLRSWRALGIHVNEPPETLIASDCGSGADRSSCRS